MRSAKKKHEWLADVHLGDLTLPIPIEFYYNFVFTLKSDRIRLPRIPSTNKMCRIDKMELCNLQHEELNEIRANDRYCELHSSRDTCNDVFMRKKDRDARAANKEQGKRAATKVSKATDHHKKDCILSIMSIK